MTKVDTAIAVSFGLPHDQLFNDQSFRRGVYSPEGLGYKG